MVYTGSTNSARPTHSPGARDVPALPTGPHNTGAGLTYPEFAS